MNTVTTIKKELWRQGVWGDEGGWKWWEDTGVGFLEGGPRSLEEFCYKREELCKEKTLFINSYQLFLKDILTIRRFGQDSTKLNYFFGRES